MSARDTAALPQQKILQDELAFTPFQRRAAAAARYLPVNCLRTGFSFNDLIKRVAVGAMEENWFTCCDGTVAPISLQETSRPHF
jgi:hypothetical protein